MLVIYKAIQNNKCSQQTLRILYTSLNCKLREFHPECKIKVHIQVPKKQAQIPLKASTSPLKTSTRPLKQAKAL